jgi:hypothetical protein
MSQYGFYLTRKTAAPPLLAAKQQSLRQLKYSGDKTFQIYVHEERTRVVVSSAILYPGLLIGHRCTQVHPD